MEAFIKKTKITILIFTLIFSLSFTTRVLAREKGEEHKLIPMGNTVGITMSSEGVIVIGLCEVDCGDKKLAPAVNAGIKIGDVITHLNSSKVDSVDGFKELISDVRSEQLSVRLTRDGKQMQFTVKPAVNHNGKTEIGIWLRDGIAGIGTMTFFDPASGIFGALGHSVSDIDTGKILPMKNGSIMKSSVVSVVRGESGSPGELQGSFDLRESIGELTLNTTHGIFGKLTGMNRDEFRIAVPVAKRSEIRVGKASILSNINGDDVEEFEIEISRVFPLASEGVRDMLVTVKDERLLQKTGGIVQGMSGSPILQNGKIVGAVTHVLVSDPRKGYAIAIENMTNEALELSASFVKYIAFTVLETRAHM